MQISEEEADAIVTRLDALEAENNLLRESVHAGIDLYNEAMGEVQSLREKLVKASTIHY